MQENQTKKLNEIETKLQEITANIPKTQSAPTDPEGKAPTKYDVKTSVCSYHLGTKETNCSANYFNVAQPQKGGQRDGDYNNMSDFSESAIELIGSKEDWETMTAEELEILRQKFGHLIVTYSEYITVEAEEFAQQAMNEAQQAMNEANNQENASIVAGKKAEQVNSEQAKAEAVEAVEAKKQVEEKNKTFHLSPIKTNDQEQQNEREFLKNYKIRAVRP